MRTVFSVVALNAVAVGAVAVDDFVSNVLFFLGGGEICLSV